MRISLFTALALVACKNDKQVTPPPSPQASGFINVLGPPPGGAPAQPVAPTAIATSAPAPMPAAAPAGGDCRAAAVRLGELNNDPSHVDQVAAECERDRWPEKLVPCIARADGKEAIQACGRLAFEGVKLDFQPQRVIDVTDADIADQQPPFFTQDGDVLAFRDHGRPCGMIGTYSGPAYATFLVCDGKVLAGPLVGEKEYLSAIELVTRAGLAEVKGMADAESAAFDLQRSIRVAMPSGGGTTTVYDRASGRPLYQTY